VKPRLKVGDDVAYKYGKGNVVSGPWWSVESDKKGRELWHDKDLTPLIEPEPPAVIEVRDIVRHEQHVGQLFEVVKLAGCKTFCFSEDLNDVKGFSTSLLRLVRKGEKA
jgi:hypothetical protein